ncbi:Putative protein in type-1 R1DM retrotransposable element [Sarcoptes scabiei]|uniref:Reverse transcriptase domain-containing protein n=1 Tax=Sarcoptes scabiei TaxID=52283 RepID=A0A834R1Y5_SARSC|nr:Putative protein in type-1 R1DM retrotransposable element [Sarcoptes scabiei]
MIQKAAYKSMPTIKRPTYQRRSIWWDDELKCMQIVVKNMRNRFSHEHDPETPPTISSLTKDYIELLISKSNSKKAPGLDHITYEILDHKIDSLVSLIAIDFSGAFDNADWDIILKNMTSLQIPHYLVRIIDSYFQNRIVSMRFNNNQYSKTMTQGCPQGSPLSPLLWNILLNSLLDSFSFGNATIHAYADDITIICHGKDITTLHRLTQEILTPIMLGSSTIQTVRQLKILGLTFENHKLKRKLNFTPHVNSIVNRTIKIKNILHCFCKNTLGVDTRKRQNLYKGLIRPVMTYGSEIWADQINKKQFSKLESLQHQILRNSIMAFRTVSKPCVTSLTKVETLQTNIKIKNTKFLHRNRIATLDTIDISQFAKQTRKSELDSIFQSTNPNFRLFFSQDIPKFIHTNFYTTQFFTGHGPFREYLSRLHITDNSDCSCSNGILQNPQHLLLDCPNYINIKHELHLHNITELASFVSDRETFKQFKKLCKHIHDHLRQELAQHTTNTPHNPN